MKEIPALALIILEKKFQISLSLPDVLLGLFLELE